MFEILPETDYIKMGVCPFCNYRRMGRIGRGKMQSLVNHISDYHTDSASRYEHFYNKMMRHYVMTHG